MLSAKSGHGFCYWFFVLACSDGCLFLKSIRPYFINNSSIYWVSVTLNSVCFSSLATTFTFTWVLGITRVSNNRYIVKTNIDETIKLIDGNLNKVFEPEYDIINTRLTSKNLYLCMNIEDNIKFNDYGFAKMNFLEDRIIKDGIVKPGNVLKVDSFLNHQMDIELFNEQTGYYKKYSFFS